MFFDLTQANIETMLGYMAGLIGDLMPLILIILGISIALFIFRAITKN